MITCPLTLAFTDPPLKTVQDFLGAKVSVATGHVLRAAIHQIIEYQRCERRPYFHLTELAKLVLLYDELRGYYDELPIIDDFGTDKP